MDVKLVARTLDVFELFAAEQRPLPLVEMARLLDVPASSCLALARTLVSRGYLYEVRKRGGYYPTRRLQLLAQAIDAVDPVVEMMHPRLVELRDASGETVVLGKIHGAAVVYLDVVESAKAVRYACVPGAQRPLHANSIGKAIFGELAPEAQAALGAKLAFERYTEATVTSLEALVEQAAAAKALGWYANLGESAPELSAVAVALDFGGAPSGGAPSGGAPSGGAPSGGAPSGGAPSGGAPSGGSPSGGAPSGGAPSGGAPSGGDLYGLSIGGPTERIRQHLDAHVQTLLEAKARILANWRENDMP